MNPPLALHCEHVRVWHPSTGRDAVTDCTLSVARGEHVALLGLNGSGKTSLLMAVANLLPHDGRIDVDGIRLSGESVREIRQRLGFLFATPEDQLLFPRVLDDVAFSLTQRHATRDEALRRSRVQLEALSMGALADAAPYELSHGQRLRAALAGVLVAAPPLLLLDEPSAALDPPGKRDLVRILAGLPSAILMATHDLEFAGHCCTRQIVLRDGRIVADSAAGDPLSLEAYRS